MNKNRQEFSSIQEQWPTVSRRGRPARLKFAVVLALGVAVRSAVGLAEPPPLQVTEQNRDQSNHIVVVESPGRFRVAVLRDYNYGLSQWYDLVNDPKATIDLPRHPIPWNPVNRDRDDAADTHYMVTHTRPPNVQDEGDQGTLFNQLVNPFDATLHGGQASHWLPPDMPGTTCRIVEQNSVRAILETKYACGKVLPHLSFTTTYCIYGTGRIGIVNTMSSSVDQALDLWRNAIIALGDPAYHFSGVTHGEGKVRDGMLTDETKSWKPDSLAGLQVNFSDYITYEIAGNTATQIKLGNQTHGPKPASDGHYQVNSQTGKFGWLRCSDLQSPYGWQSSTSAYLREYWDPATPEPFKNRTKASILLVPQPGNPRQGGQGTHGWDFFKRFYYEYGKFDLKAGQGITQHYMIQLGTKGDTVLPDLSNNDAAKAYADDYRNPPELTVTSGSLGTPPFDSGLACHRLAATNGKLVFTPRRTLLNPVFEVTGLAGAVHLKSEKGPLDFVSAQTGSNAVVLQVWGTLEPGLSIEVTAKK